MVIGIIDETLNEAGQFTTPLHVNGLNINAAGSFDIAIAGEFTGTLVMKLSPDGLNWVNTGDTFDSPCCKVGQIATYGFICIGIEEGANWTGTAYIRIAQY